VFSSLVHIFLSLRCSLFESSYPYNDQSPQHVLFSGLQNFQTYGVLYFALHNLHYDQFPWPGVFPSPGDFKAWGVPYFELFLIMVRSLALNVMCFLAETVTFFWSVP
jgi:hypothetical protein